MFSGTRTRSVCVLSFVLAAAGIGLGIWAMHAFGFAAGAAVAALLLAGAYLEFRSGDPSPAEIPSALVKELLAHQGEAPVRVPRRMVVAPAQETAAEAARAAAPVTLTESTVKCPCCGLIQRSDRKRCFDCGVYFEQ